MQQLLKYTLMPMNALTRVQRSEMYALMQANYNEMNESNFHSDLDKKQFVGIISDTSKHLQGFTTFAINPGDSGTEQYNILFSGDTVLSPEQWGSQIMMQGWCESVGSIIASDSSKEWYWYLMSKGHRTYLYLPLFFKVFYPAPDISEDNMLKQITDRVSRILFSSDWYPDLGIVRFPHSLGELKPELVDAAYQKAKSKNIGFFLERNPGFFKGDELICLAPLFPDNMLRSARDFMISGMEHPLKINVS